MTGNVSGWFIRHRIGPRTALGMFALVGLYFGVRLVVAVWPWISWLPWFLLFLAISVVVLFPISFLVGWLIDKRFDICGPHSPEGVQPAGDPKDSPR